MRSIILLAVILALVLAVNAGNTDEFANFTAISDSGPPNGKVCDGASTLTPADGTQQRNIETCSDTELGEIPIAAKMPSTIILFPENASTLPANKSFTIKLVITNLKTGFFDNATSQYYLFSQQLDSDGIIIGHTHVTVQKLDSIDTPPDAQIFAFFKGLNQPADANGLLTQDVADGLPAGLYRLCTMSASFAHTPVIMPVAQRGAQDDCIRFNVK
ncbi:8042_t:CDS:1 [Paraglomus brasilianum]|uniref:8042_t:CDS:1 n=1 Tax=Paraglomus brasilianum TaxID=144538 RepID=A0A9N8WCZ9_9GLOM|nr:8042_t:CDS:1 [Paraglomus brasilianum]